MNWQKLLCHEFEPPVWTRQIPVRRLGLATGQAVYVRRVSREVDDGIEQRYDESGEAVV